MPINKPFTTSDPSIKTVFTGVHRTQTYIASNDNTGVFIDNNKVLIRAGNTSISVGNDEVNINGRLVKERMMNGSSRALMHNPLGIIPGNILPPLIPASFQYLPDAGLLVKFAGIGLKIASLIGAVTGS